MVAMAGFFCWGGEKKTMQGQHLIESLNKSHLVMYIAIEGPDLKEVNFNHVFKDQNHRIYHNHNNFWGGGGGGGL